MRRSQKLERPSSDVFPGNWSFVQFSAVCNFQCAVGPVENGNKRVFKNLLAFFAAIW